MANEIRLRSNNMSGTISDNPLAQVSTTINSPEFVDLPVVDGTNHLILVLDPLEVNGAAEIVQVTAHTAAASSVTVTRGFEGSVPRAHILGTTWFHGPVVSDYNYTQRTALSTNRPAAPFNGELIYSTDNNRWEARSSGGVWLPSPHNVPACRVFQAGALNIADGVVVTVTFDSERYDTDNMHSTSVNTSRITFNTPGVYHVVGNILFAGADYASVFADIRLNASTGIAAQTVGAFTDAGLNTVGCTVSTFYKFSAGDFVEMRAWQNNTTGVARSILTTNYSPEFSATWVGVG